MKRLYSIKRLLIALLAFGPFASCSSFVYEDESDCTVYYRLKFRYDMNLKFADAFAHEVKSVRLYAFNTDSYTHLIPMSSVYEVAIGDKSKECRLCLVRTATKFTFRFKNMRSGAVAVNSIAVSDIARSTFLMPRKKNPMMTFEEADGSRSELFWIDWLKRVAEESLETPDDKELADKRGWITDYDIPAGAVSDSVVVAAPADFRVAGLVYDMGVPKPGEAVYPVLYLPESKSLKEPGTGAYGEQAYTMAFELTDDNNAKRKFSRPFDNLKALFRNTHVVVDVTFLEKGVQVDVIPYSEVILTPEFGL